LDGVDGNRLHKAAAAAAAVKRRFGLQASGNPSHVPGRPGSQPGEAAASIALAWGGQHQRKGDRFGRRPVIESVKTLPPQPD